MISIKNLKLLNDIKFRLLILIFLALTLITLFSTTNSYSNDVLIEVNIIIPENPGNPDEGFLNDILYLNNKKDVRPPDGYVVDLDRIDEHCEPTSYNKSSLKRYPMQECLDYLDKKQFDYFIKPKSPKYCNESDPMLFHAFWRGKITDKLSLFIKSFLYTQPLKCALLYVWIDSVNEDIQSNPYVIPLLRFLGKNIVFKSWITEEHLGYDPLFNGWQRLLKENRKIVAFSDIVRFALLHRYGGIYFDVDALLLRDMSPFYNLDIDFAYRWSIWKHYNTAILRLHPNSTVGRLIIEAAMNNEIDFHPMSIRSYLTNNKSVESITREDLNKHLYMVPVILFDPLWLKADLHYRKIPLKPNLYRWNDAFNSKLLDNEFPGIKYNNNLTDPLKLRHKNNFFRGAFTYHWHNQWNKKIRPKSWLGVMLSAYDAFLEGRDSNLYGEYLRN